MKATHTLVVLPLGGGDEQLVVFEPAADCALGCSAFCIAVRAEGIARIVGGGTLFAAQMASDARTCFPTVRPARDWCDGSDGSESGDEDGAAPAEVMSDFMRPAAYGDGDDGLTACVRTATLDSLRRDHFGTVGVYTFIVCSSAVAFVCATARSETDESITMLLPAWRTLRARKRAGGGKFADIAVDNAAATVIALGAACVPGAPHCFGGRTAHESIDFIRRRFASGSKTELVLPSASPHEAWERLAALVAAAALRPLAAPAGLSSSRVDVYALRRMRGSEALRTSRARCNGAERIRWVCLDANRAPSTQARVCTIA